MRRDRRFEVPPNPISGRMPAAVGIRGNLEPSENPPVRARCSEEPGNPDLFLWQLPCHYDHLPHREPDAAIAPLALRPIPSA